MFRSKSFLAQKPKNAHSLENLKYLYNVLVRHQMVTESNRALLVETLRSMSEILIWGDQNDSTVFDYFLEKNMLEFFLRYLKQKTGQYICVQLLQTLNILFENISNETSIYYLMSNNHVNSIISHNFDFSDEEVMAYYISFMKTLSLKLNKHTIHFFFNELSENFPLYTDAIKFFDHPESMVRIAVRTITLNVYKVENTRMQTFIREKTASAYFSNMCWFMGSHILELDSCVRNDIDHKSRDRLSDLVAEHLDLLHYLNDIFSLAIEPLNNVLTDYLLNRLFVPLYINSLIPTLPDGTQTEVPRLTLPVALFILSQVFLIIHHKPLVCHLTSLLFGTARCVMQGLTVQDSVLHPCLPRFAPPIVSLSDDYVHNDKLVSSGLPSTNPPSSYNLAEDFGAADSAAATPQGNFRVDGNVTDDHKIVVQGLPVERQTARSQQMEALRKRPYMQTMCSCLDAVEDDYNTLLVLCLLYAVGDNQGVKQEILDSVNLTTNKSPTKDNYNTQIVEKLIKIIVLSGQFAGKVRLATLELAILVLEMVVVMVDGTSCLLDDHLAVLEGTKEEIMMLLRSVFKTEEMFLDMFEDEFREMARRKLNVEYLTMDASVLLQPTGTPLTGIEFTKRLPCGEVERVRRAIRVFFHIRKLLQKLHKEDEMQLPLTNPEESVKIGDVLDLNNSDLIGCTVVRESGAPKRERRFLVIDTSQLIMVEPDASRLGWGVVRLSCFLQDVEVMSDKEDSRCLHVTVHKAASSHLAKPLPLLTAKFIFDDHIRCLAAKQRLTKGRAKARQRKMLAIASLLEMSANEANRILLPLNSSVFSSSQRPLPGRVVAHTSNVLSSDPSSQVTELGVDAASTLYAKKDYQPSTNSHLPRHGAENLPLGDIDQASPNVAGDQAAALSDEGSSSRDSFIRHNSLSRPIIPFGSSRSDTKDV